jgi:hypothetical protein
MSAANAAFAQTGEFSEIRGISQFEQLPQHLRDRGPGAPTSMFATFIRDGEFIVYPFFEYYYNTDAEYKPAEFGYGLDQDFRGKFLASEYLIFLGYGLTDRLALELEGAYIDGSLEKSDEDTTAMPAKIEESGLGDFQTQIDWMWKNETAGSPGFYSYFETVFPHNKDKDLIGTSDWEFKFGTGIIRGFAWGTVKIRAAGEYIRDEDKLEVGELAVEYLKRISAHWRLYGGIESTQDETELITDIQWHINDRVFVRVNNAFGITSKAADWAPEIGVLFSLY